MSALLTENLQYLIIFAETIAIPPHKSHGMGYANAIHKPGGITMSVSFAESETKKNLLRAFAGESQARNRYTFAAGVAKKNNLYVIESVFTFTANQELSHAKIFYDQLSQFPGENIPIDGNYPIDLYPTML